MLIALWILNSLLALAFLGAGGMKLIRPRQAIIDGGMQWADDYQAPAVKAIGIVEVLGALGLIVPLITGIAHILSPLAAIGLAIVMIAAAVVHTRRQEPPMPAVILAILAAASAVLGFITLT